MRKEASCWSLFASWPSGAWHWSTGKVQRFLKNLEEHHMIKTEAKQGMTMITVCKYDRYNDRESSNETEAKHAQDKLETNTKHEQDKPDTSPEQERDKRDTKLRREKKEEEYKKNREGAHASQDEDLVEKAIRITLAYYQNHPDRKTLLLDNSGFREGVNGDFETEVRKFWNHHYENEYLLSQPLKHLKRFQSWLLRAKEFNKPVGKVGEGSEKLSRSGPYRLL